MANLSTLLETKLEPLMSEVVGNAGVRAALKAQGDDGVAIRHVRHFAYPDDSDPALRGDIVSQLKACGLEVSDVEPDGALLIEQYRSVAGDDFDRFTSGLREWFSERGWDYDGWECALVASKGAAAR